MNPLMILGVSLFLVAVGGLSWMGWVQGSKADALETAKERAAEKARREWVNKIESRRARLRDAERRGVA